MNMKSVMAVLLVVLLVEPAALARQRPEPPDTWRAYAERLEAGAFVRVRLKEGTSVKGHFIQVASDSLRVKPKTRMAVPIRNITFASIASVERQNEGRSPGTNVLIGVGIGAAAIVALALTAIAALTD